MAGKIMELAIAIKGKIDSSLAGSAQQASGTLQDLQKQMASLQRTAQNAEAWNNQKQCSPRKRG